MTEVLEKTLELINAYCKSTHNSWLSTATADMDFRDIGIDSLDHVEIVIHIEEHFNVVLKDADLDKTRTPRDIAKLVVTALGQPKTVRRSVVCTSAPIKKAPRIKTPLEQDVATLQREVRELRSTVISLRNTVAELKSNAHIHSSMARRIIT